MLSTTNYTNCSQTTKDGPCKETPVYRYTYPGQDEKVICERHSKILMNIANAIGLHLQLIELD